MCNNGDDGDADDNNNDENVDDDGDNDAHPVCDYKTSRYTMLSIESLWTMEMGHPESTFYILQSHAIAQMPYRLDRRTLNVPPTRHPVSQPN